MSKANQRRLIGKKPDLQNHHSDSGADLPMTHMLDQLYEFLVMRKQDAPEHSYTAQLYAKGRAKIAQKLGEEAVETVIEAMALQAAPDDPKIRRRLVEESADLLYHLLVLWADADLPPQTVWAELAARHVALVGTK